MFWTILGQVGKQIGKMALNRTMQSRGATGSVAGLTSNIIDLFNNPSPNTGQSSPKSNNLIDSITNILTGNRTSQGGQAGQPTLAGNLSLARECPDPNGVHGKGIMMNLTLMYGKPMYLCPSCAHMEQG